MNTIFKNWLWESLHQAIVAGWHQQFAKHQLDWDFLQRLIYAYIPKCAVSDRNEVFQPDAFPLTAQTYRIHHTGHPADSCQIRKSTKSAPPSPFIPSIHRAAERWQKNKSFSTVPQTSKLRPKSETDDFSLWSTRLG